MATNRTKQAETSVLSENSELEGQESSGVTEPGNSGTGEGTESGTETDDGMVTFKIPKGRDNQTRRDVFVGLNGRPYLIKRGEYVKMPKAIAEILEHQEEQLDYADSVMEQSSYEEL